jgi:hypothetical protein
MRKMACDADRVGDISDDMNLLDETNAAICSFCFATQNLLYRANVE